MELYFVSDEGLGRSGGLTRDGTEEPKIGSVRDLHGSGKSSQGVFLDREWEAVHRNLQTDGCKLLLVNSKVRIVDTLGATVILAAAISLYAYIRLTDNHMVFSCAVVAFVFLSVLKLISLYRSR